ncbi:MAG: SDR family oxidoreductase [Gammaproteobacteria bacterium]|nr:SDR family oxidoreductase [Gammaproteobacteria bacterium]
MYSSEKVFLKQNVVVTAGASGIGYFIAKSFLKAGANVHIIDIDKKALEQAKVDLDQSTDSCPDHDLGTVLFSQADVSNEANVDEVFKRHQDGMGGVDVMVNCAGIAGPTAPVEDVTLAQWHQCLGVNLDATFLFSRKVVPLMKEAKKGRIINISSTAGWHGYPLRSPYASAKWAIIGFTKSLAMELGKHGITANAICPGSVDGDRMDRVIAAEARNKNVSEEEIRHNYTKGCSMRTFISGQDIADMALFLASQSASRVSGQIMNVDGHLEYFGGLD